ncbi:MAG: putative transcriptional regulator [Miltoncostaeaceae bacterium]|nr:putative transcriptional regulator [Miltoncostaeaceae bacterium]
MSAPVAPALKGRLLVASPALDDPNFRRTVVLMLEHTADGSVGLVLNRPTPVLAREALPDALGAALAEEERVHQGGPVQPEAVLLLGDFVEPDAAAGIAFGSVGIVDPEADPAKLESKVRQMRAFGGYAGWAGGQLEAEFAEGAWIDAVGLPSDVFTTEPDSLWSEVLRRKGGRYRLIAQMPEDPSLN